MKITKLNNPLVGKVIPNNSPDKIENTQSAPYYFVCLLQISFPHAEGFGTGILVKDDKHNATQYVLTCAHNLYNEDYGGKAVSVNVVRGYSNPNQPYGPIEGKEWFYPDGYPSVAISSVENLENFSDEAIQADINLDYGLIKLSSPVENIEGLPKLTVETTEALINLEVQINGYGVYDTLMSHATGSITHVEDKCLRYPITTMPGASGSAILKGDGVSIVGIHTRSVPGVDLNQGVRITAEVKSTIEEWMRK